MKIHRLTESEIAERNRKIEKMLSYGCDYSDISRRYGVSPNYICTMVKKGKIKKGVLSYFRSTGDFGRSCFVDGVR